MQRKAGASNTDLTFKSTIGFQKEIILRKLVQV